MSTILQSLKTSEIQKGINLLGLKITESELNELQVGNAISLEDRGLSEIGSVFILAEALSAVNSVKSITFGDLPKVSTSSRSGIPIYCWNCERIGKCCMVLTLVDGNPAIKVAA
ncbi:MAG TPA: hypothetical protein DEV81_20430 [Cyanobacteria bacterium UBA11049]|nr:hypothetical protein [Cyanobacteria bacterium UBA11049]